MFGLYLSKEESAEILPFINKSCYGKGFGLSAENYIVFEYMDEVFIIKRYKFNPFYKYALFSIHFRDFLGGIKRNSELGRLVNKIWNESQPCTEISNVYYKNGDKIKIIDLKNSRHYLGFYKGNNYINKEFEVYAEYDRIIFTKNGANFHKNDVQLISIKRDKNKITL